MLLSPTDKHNITLAQLAQLEALEKNRNRLIRQINHPYEFLCSFSLPLSILYMTFSLPHPIAINAMHLLPDLLNQPLTTMCQLVERMNSRLACPQHLSNTTLQLKEVILRIATDNLASSFTALNILEYLKKSLFTILTVGYLFFSNILFAKIFPHGIFQQPYNQNNLSKNKLTWSFKQAEEFILFLQNQCRVLTPVANRNNMITNLLLPLTLLGCCMLYERRIAPEAFLASLVISTGTLIEASKRIFIWWHNVNYAETRQERMTTLKQIFEVFAQTTELAYDDFHDISITQLKIIFTNFARVPAKTVSKTICNALAAYQTLFNYISKHTVLVSLTKKLSASDTQDISLL